MTTPTETYVYAAGFATIADCDAEADEPSVREDNALEWLATPHLERVLATVDPGRCDRFLADCASDYAELWHQDEEGEPALHWEFLGTTYVGDTGIAQSMSWHLRDTDKDGALLGMAVIRRVPVY